MKRLRALSVPVVLTSACMAYANPGVRASLIYGEDDRLSFSEIEDPALREVSRATAAKISITSLSRAGIETRIRSGSLAESVNVCAEEPFRDEPAAASCSGFLVAPDLLVTAGHCMARAADCRGSRWVFDFTDLALPGSPAAEGWAATVPASSVYACAEVVEQRFDRVTMLDYALVRLDRPVPDRAPLKFRTAGQVPAGQELVLIGYPSGLPLKAAGGAFVRSNASPVYFVANTDSYGGNSGSAVVNRMTGEVEGILVRGETDYVLAPNRRCRVSYRCADDACRGEDITRITQVEALMRGAAEPIPAPSPSVVPALSVRGEPVVAPSPSPSLFPSSSIQAPASIAPG